jgi:hypothetical protein
VKVRVVVRGRTISSDSTDRISGRNLLADRYRARLQMDISRKPSTTMIDLDHVPCIRVAERLIYDPGCGRD